jgi:hypothetical protein
MASITVERSEGSLIDRRSLYRVMIDGVFRGTVASCGAVTFDVPVGTHTVKICIDSYCSAPIKVDVLGSIRLTCRPNIAHAFGMMSMIPVSGWISMREEFDPAPMHYRAANAAAACAN